MKALILNSGMGKRMGNITANQPKCMTQLSDTETILSRQLMALNNLGVDEVIITTGYYHEVIESYCKSLNLPIFIKYIKSPRYDETNYIYSIYCAKELLDDDIILMHGDLVFEYNVLEEIAKRKESCMKVSSTLQLPEKDFKAVIKDGRVQKVGVNYFDDAVEAQALYKLNKKDWKIWLEEIVRFCEEGKTDCYAEEALNNVTNVCEIYGYDARDSLCAEIDTPEDLAVVKAKLRELESKTVYMCFSTDVIHSGHIAIIRKAEKYGKLIIGVLSDEAVASYKKFPLLPFEERCSLFENIAGVHKVVEQKTLSYKENLEKYKPTYVVHGDDWKEGIQKSIRDEVTSILASYGGCLIEFPFSIDEKYAEIERRTRLEMATPDMRRGRLRRALEIKGLITAMEAHSGLTGLIVENTVVEEHGGAKQFDAMWISSLCDSTAKGKPDIELVDMTSRFRTIDDICEVTTKPIIFDGDTGGLTEHFVYTVRSLERMGVSMIIIEDKIGLKKNSLFGTEVAQTQDDVQHFCEKIAAGKKAQRTQDFMICARIESLILEKGMQDALDRAYAYRDAGADAIMIHSRKADPTEIFEFVDRFRKQDINTPIVVVPTAFNSVTEEEFKNRGVNVVIYANQLTRTGFPAMKHAAEVILRNHRAKECDDICMPFKEIIRMIPEE